MAYFVCSTQTTRAKPAHGHQGAPGTGGEAVKRKPPTHKRCYGGGWKESPRPPLTPEGKRRRREWLFAHRLYLHRLMLRETER
jgi:hypothetical protein